jgi:tetratricopeptide (TPR) repeat protein
MSYFELRPNRLATAQSSSRPFSDLSIADQTIVVDADFSTGGPWAGVSLLVEKAYLWLTQQRADAILERHNYELHMVLVQHRNSLPLRYGSLTDLAEGAEKTRNFPLDRAYRLVHGLVDFIIKWQNAEDFEDPLLIIVENFSRAQHLSKRFFLELARRGTGKARLRIVVSSEASPDLTPTSRIYAEPISIGILPSLPGSALIDEISSPSHADQCLAGLKTFEDVELHVNKLLTYYKSVGDGFGYAKAALAALHACNHYGYYYEASSFVEAILPYFDRLVQGSEENRWNYTGNLFHSLIVQGAIGEARDIINRIAVPYLTKKALRAKMEYILGIVEVRYKTPPDLKSAEEHFSSAVSLIGLAGDELELYEYVFLKVFIENGLALLRVRQGRRQEAIQLCQSGFQLLTNELGDEIHKLHRSVLQYNTAQVYNMMGELDLALQHYRQAALMDPNYSEYYNEMGNIYQRQGLFGDAINSYNEAIRLSAPYPEVHFNRAVCLAREGNWQMALESCDYSLALNPNQPDAHLIRAEICENIGRIDDALTSYDEAIALASNMIPARVNKAVLLFNQCSFNDALDEMNDVISLDSSEPSHYDNRAAIYRELGNIGLCLEDERLASFYRSRTEVKAEELV